MEKKLILNYISQIQLNLDYILTALDPNTYFYIEPVLYEETEHSVYQEMFDVSRTLTESETKQYER